MSVEAAIAAVPMAPDTHVILNDPYAGGTHLPDVTLVSPVFLAEDDEGPTFFVANRAHHADVGGISPGSMPAPFDADGASRPLSIADEGWRSPPVELTDAVREAGGLVGVLDPTIVRSSKELLSSVTVLVTVVTIMCWWGFAFYVYRRRGYFLGERAAAPAAKDRS